MFWCLFVQWFIHILFTFTSSSSNISSSQCPNPILCEVIAVIFFFYFLVQWSHRLLITFDHPSKPQNISMSDLSICEKNTFFSFLIWIGSYWTMTSEFSYNCVISSTEDNGCSIGPRAIDSEPQKMRTASHLFTSFIFYNQKLLSQN